MDFINACFEFGGFLAVIPSILAVLRDKCVQGVSHWTYLFLVSWGVWNIVYYPHLDQIWSAWAAVLITLTNAIYLALLFRYRNKAVYTVETIYEKGLKGEGLFEEVPDTRCGHES